MEFGCDWFEHSYSLASFSCVLKLRRKRTEADFVWLEVPVGSWQKVNLPLSLSTLYFNVSIYISWKFREKWMESG